MPQSKPQPQSLQDICDQLRNQVEEVEGKNLQVQDVLDAFSGRVFGPLLLVPAVVVMIPLLGAIPTVPSLMGLLVVLIAGQALVGRKYPWVPRFLAEREISKEKFNKSLDWSRPWVARIDWLTKPRLRWLVMGPMKYVIALLCILLAGTLPLLEVLPFVAAIPAFAIFCLGLAMTAEDGLLGLLGLLATIGTVGTLFWWWM